MERGTKKPTDRQKIIIEDRHFPRYLTAGPGTGKTEVLVNKIIYLTENEPSLKPEEIAVITFTNKAADEMRERLLGRATAGLKEGFRPAAVTGARKADCLRSHGPSGPRYGGPAPSATAGPEGFEVSTIHSFCSRLLRRYGKSPYFSIKSYENEMARLIQAALNDAAEPLFQGVSKQRLYHIVQNILRECYNHGILLSDEYLMKNKAEAGVWAVLEEAVLSLCTDVYNKLEEMKKEENALTLNDLITHGAKLLENDNIRGLIAKGYKYLFVDEFQDTNRRQLDIVKMLIEAGVKIFLIGDEKQSIYGFRGADIDCSKEAKEMMERSAVPTEDAFFINENFRSDWPLLMKINEVFDKPFMYKGKRLNFPQAALTKTEELKAAPGASDNPFRYIYETDVSDIVEQLKKETLNGVPVRNEDIFILCRTNMEVWQISMELDLKGGGDIPWEEFGKKEIINLYKLFNAVLFKDEAALKELIFTPYASLADSVKELDLVFRDKTIEGIFEFLYEKTGVRSLEFENIGRDMPALDFFEYLEALTEFKDNKKEGAVNIMTIHKAKGLSLPVVIIPNTDRHLLVEAMMPDYVIDKGAKAFAIGDVLRRYGPSPRYLELAEKKIIRDLEEEIRVLYVAMTRAEHILIMGSKKSKNALKKEQKDDEIVTWAKWLAGDGL